VSGHGIEPWPGVPTAVRLSGSPVFSEMMMEANGARLCGSISMPPSSDSAYSAPASQSGCVAAMNWAPNALPASSSAVARKTRSRVSRAPARLSASTAASCRMPVDFMSMAPRP